MNGGACAREASIDKVFSGPPVNPSLGGCGKNIPVFHAPENTLSIESPLTRSVVRE